MRFACNLTALPTGEWEASHWSRDMGVVTARAASRDSAIDKLRGEIRYHLELCPCTGETYQHIEVEIVEARK